MDAALALKGPSRISHAILKWRGCLVEVVITGVAGFLESASQFTGMEVSGSSQDRLSESLSSSLSESLSESLRTVLL